MSRLPRLTPRKLPQQDRSRALVDAVLEAAKRVIVRDGITDARIVDIAELAGVSPGSLYQYFPNLASVVALLHVTLLENAIADLTDNLLEHRDSPVEDVAAVIALVPLRNVRDDVEVHRALALAAPRLGTERKLAPVLERERALLKSFLGARADESVLPPDVGERRNAGRAEVMPESVARALARVCLPEARAMEARFHNAHTRRWLEMTEAWAA